MRVDFDVRGMVPALIVETGLGFVIRQSRHGQDQKRTKQRVELTGFIAALLSWAVCINSLSSTKRAIPYLLFKSIDCIYCMRGKDCCVLTRRSVIECFVTILRAVLRVVR